MEKNVKTKKELTDDAQRVFNEFVRIRDSYNACISCGSLDSAIYHAGHYLSSSPYTELRFNEKNVNKQCQRCNKFLHGNLIRYRQGLIKKIGVEAVEELESPHEKIKYSEEFLNNIKIKYRLKIKELRNGK